MKLTPGLAVVEVLLGWVGLHWSRRRL